MKSELFLDVQRQMNLDFVIDENESDVFAMQSARLKELIAVELQRYDGARRKEVENAINAFITDETQKRKLIVFSTDFVDPTVKPKKSAKKSAKNPLQNSGIKQLSAFLTYDEVCSLYDFVMRHEKDNTFGATVNKVMTKHKMTAPDVYKSAFLRRQDFSRATDPKAGNVSKHIVWQIILGLHCNLDEADMLLFSAGYIRRRNRFDLVMEYFIKHKNYDVLAINDVLNELKLKPFSCYKAVKDKDNR